MAHFGATTDSLENISRFAEVLAVDYPLLSDPGREVAKAYGVVRDDTSLATRWTFYIGLDGTILYIDRQVSPGTHGEAVVAKLAELGVTRRTARGGR